jgi:ABC-2 type transport system permease protein
MTAYTQLWRLFTADLLTKGRVAALAILTGGIVLIAWAVARTSPEEPVADAVLMLTNVGLALVVPLVSLVFATGSLGNLREDKTLVHVWFTPIATWIVPAAALVASATIAIPPIVVSMGLAAAVFGTGAQLILATVATALLAAVAYCSLFTLLGVLLRRSLLWGLGYVLIWEGIVAGAGTTAARLSIRVYSTSLLNHLNDLEPPSPSNSAVAALLVLAGITTAAFAINVRTYRRLAVE